LLGQAQVNCFNYAYEKGKMSVSQRRGVITLVPKEDSNLLLLSNWWPITLLRVVFKENHANLNGWGQQNHFILTLLIG